MKLKKGGTLKMKKGLKSFLLLFFFFFIVSLAVNYYLFREFSLAKENISQQEISIEKLEKNCLAWEFAFREFYFHSRENEKMGELAHKILIKAFSNKFAEEEEWTAKEQLQWEITVGEKYVEDLLEINNKNK